MMKKSIIVVLVLISICLLPNSCKKAMKGGSENVYPKIEIVDTQKDVIPIDQKEVKVQCKNGFLFKASYSDKLQIKQFNFDNMKDELIGELNSSFGFPQEFLRIPNIVEEFNNVAFGFSHLVISPDKKKLAFLGESPRRDFYEKNYFDFPYDLYAMNVDGSDIKRITFDMKYVPYGEGSDLRILFTPDSQEIIIYGLSWRDFFEEAIYIVNIAQNTCVQYDENHELFWPIFSYVKDKSQAEKTKTFTQSYNEDFPILSYGENSLVWFKNEIGTFNWKLKEYKKIYSMPAEESIIWSASWFPDFTKIFFEVKDSLFIYDIPIKELITITATAYLRDYQVIENGKQVLYFSNELHLCCYHIETKKTTLIKDFQGKVNYIDIYKLDEVRYLIKCYSGAFVYTSSDQSLLEYSLPKRSDNYVYLDNYLYYTTGQEFARHDLQSNTDQYLYEFEYASFFQDKYEPECFFMPDKQVFCFQFQIDFYYAKLFILDKDGILIDEIEEICDYPNRFIDQPLRQLSNNYYYYTLQSQPSDLYYAKSIQDKPINLTQGQFPVLRSEVSPDQQNVAFYSLNPSTNMASVHLLNLKAPDNVTTLASFQLYYHEKDSPHEEYLYEHFLTLSWSKDSQWIYFVTRDKSKRFMINRVKSDGKEMTLLSDPKSSSFGSMISPDSTQIVYVTGEERKIALMNTDGTNKKIISDGIATKQCFFPAWSPDGKMIAFNQLMVEDRYDNNTSPSNQIMIITPQGKVIAKNDCMFIDPSKPKLEFIQAKNFWSYSSSVFACLKSIDNHSESKGPPLVNIYISIYRNAFQEEESIKPITHSFKWAHSKDMLMLFEWVDIAEFIYVDKNLDYENTIQLYDCVTKQFTTVTKDVFYVFEAAWSPEDSEVLYAGTDIHSGQVVFKVAKSDGSTEQLFLSFGENPIEQPSSIADIKDLVWLKK